MSNSNPLLENKQSDQLIPNGGSHDNHVTVGTSNNGEFGVFDQVLLTGTDPYFDFDSSEGRSSNNALDPSIANNIPFYEDCFTEDSPKQTDQFDPALFDSILSSNDDILSRLDSTSSISSGTSSSQPVLSYDLVVDNEGTGSGTGSELEGEEEGRKKEELLESIDPFDEFIREQRTLSTIVEVQGEGCGHSDESDSDYVHLDDIVLSTNQETPPTNNHPLIKPQPQSPPPPTTRPQTPPPILTQTPPPPESSSPLPTQPQTPQPEESSPQPSTQPHTPTQTHNQPSSPGTGGGSEGGAPSPPGASSPSVPSPLGAPSPGVPPSPGDSPPLPPRSTSLRSSSFTSTHSAGDQVKGQEVNSATVGGVVEDDRTLTQDADSAILSSPVCASKMSPKKSPRVPIYIPSAQQHAGGGEGTENWSQQGSLGWGEGMTLMQTKSATLPVMTTPPTSPPTAPPISSGAPALPPKMSPPRPPKMGMVSPPTDHTPRVSSGLNQSISAESNLDSGNTFPREKDASDLDRGSRRMSNTNASPVLRAKSPHTPPSRRPSSEMAVLQPLSPEHEGVVMNEQYEFLRRTLSHSQRRYSQRGKNPRKGRGEGLGRGGAVGRSLRNPPDNAVVNGHLSGSERALDRNSEDSRQKKTIGNLRDITRNGEAPAHQNSADLETHVDQHGRTYYMDHNTRTIAFDRSVNVGATSPAQLEMQTRREMLDRRYQSLQRSFRRNERPQVNIRNRATFSLNRSGGGGGGGDQPSGGMRTENNSLSLTLAEAEDISRRLSGAKSKQRTSSGKSGRWFFSRKSKSKSDSTQRESSTGISTPPSSIEGSPAPEVGGSDSTLTRSSGSESSSRSRNGSETVETAITVGGGGGNLNRDRNRELTPGSIQSVEFESGTEEDPSRTSNTAVETETAQTTDQSGGRDVRQDHVQEPSNLASGAGEGVFTTVPQANRAAGVSPDDHNNSLGGGVAGLRDRQTSIVHASNLTQADRNSAARARAIASSKKKNRQRLNTDEVTNTAVSEQNNNGARTEEEEVAGRGQSSPTPTPTITTTTIAAKDEEKKAESGGISRGSIRKSKRSAKNLIASPALRFITRKDLYTFLSSAGVAGEEFFANRALMELVQRIRSNHSLFEKYEHSHHLVGALNKFADIHSEIPDGWEKKLNREGKIFFIDHKNELTTFLDPRLPLPDSQYVYNPAPEKVVRQQSEPTAIRPHHTTFSHSPSLDVPTIVTPEPTTPTSPTPTSTSSSNSGTLTPTNSALNRMSVISTATVASAELISISYEEQVVAFFRQMNIVEVISERYTRGVRPQFQVVIDAIQASGTSALERIQQSGSVATYELALVMSLFDEEIGRMQPNVEPVAPSPPPVLLVTATPPTTPSHKAMLIDQSGKSTIQRRKEAFPTKLQNFKMMMARLGFVQGSRIKYNIRRGHLLEDAYEHIMKSDVKLLQRKRLNITFKGEEGLDYGGPSREFFFLLSREIFNPYYGLFEYSANDTYTIQISSTAAFIHNSQEWFRFAGRVVGLVIVQGFLLDVFFTRTVYKSLLCRHPSIKDLEALEPAFYNSLLWIRDNDPEPLDLTFTVEEEAFGKLNAHELKPGGDDIPVTEDNKDEYIDLMVRWRLDRGVAEQMNAFKKGFGEILPVHLLSNFDHQELEFITAGTLEIDIEDWKGNTEYRNGYHAVHQVILWFWEAVEKFDNEERLRLLQFVTGTSSVPIAGFKALRGSNGPKRFTIDYFNDANAFPRSHTCFNRVDLPPYPSFEVLYNKLRYAVTEGGGFGIE